MKKAKLDTGLDFAFCDPVWIQTRNLLIRSQMLLKQNFYTWNI